MNRSKWKGSFINLKDNNITNLSKDNNISSTQQVYSISRDSDIVHAFIGLKFNVYNGKTYNQIEVTDQMLGLKFGTLSFTRAKFVFTKKKKKKTKKK